MIRTNFVSLILVMSFLSLIIGNVALIATTAEASTFPTAPPPPVERASESTSPATINSTGNVNIQSTHGPIITRTVRYRRTFRSLVGLEVAWHDAITWWTFGNGRLYDSPRGMENDWWTMPPTFMSGQSAQWDWYHPVLNGTGRSNLEVIFTFGVPTPWGPIGSNFNSRILTTVRFDGTHSAN